MRGLKLCLRLSGEQSRSQGEGMALEEPEPGSASLQPTSSHSLQPRGPSLTRCPRPHAHQAPARTSLSPSISREGSSAQRAAQRPIPRGDLPSLPADVGGRGRNHLCRECLLTPNSSCTNPRAANAAGSTAGICFPSGTLFQ